jgi:hypothetical protein
MTRLIPLVVVTGLLVVAGVVVALVVGADDDDGGGGDTTELGGYFQTLNTTQTQIRTDYSAVESQFPNAFVDKQETLDYLTGSSDAWANGVTALEAIEAPDEVADEHLALVQATDDVSTAFQDLHTTAQDTDEAGLEDMVNNADTTAFDAYSETCLALQDVADANEVLDADGQPVQVVC